MSGKAICTSFEWRGRPDCVNCAVRKTVLFANLDESVLSGLLSSVSNCLYDEGSTLCHQGDPATSLFSLRKGVIKLEIFDGNGDASIMRLLGPGAVVGLETTLGTGESYCCTATALSRLDACRIPLQVFQRLMNEHPEHYKVIVSLWKRHLEAADEALLGFRSGELRERLVNILRTLSIFAGDSKSFLLPSGRDLSALTGATPVAISRVMAGFKREGVLRQVTGKEYSLQDEE
ncbi:MAG: Crp/Fnr family transcriptional regulator [Chromatiales bacterium]|jgi:CRP-like cAMP-binding protein